MKKRWAAMLLCVLLLLQLGGISSSATGNVYFMGVEENILPLSDSTMPFWSNNYLYIPSSIFTGTVRTSLGVGQTLASDGRWVALYKGDEAILFKDGNAYGEDPAGKLYYPGAVKRNGQFFVPVSVIANYFGWTYSVKKVSNGWLVWLRTKDFILSEDQFADAASSMMNQRYASYMGEKSPTSESQPIGPEMPELEAVSGKKIYLNVRANQQTREILSVLDRYGAKMTFFCTPEFLEENDDLLRYMIGTGQGIGILATEDEAGISVMEQIRAGNAALVQATGEKTRLIRIEKASAETITDVIGKGYCPQVSELNASRYSLKDSYQAALLFRTVSTTQQPSVLWLDQSVQIGGLASFLAQISRVQEYCLPMTETVEVS